MNTPLQRGPEDQSTPVEIPGKLCNLPPCEPIAAKLLQLSADEDCDIGSLTDVIKADPAISTEILRLANSPLFGAISRFHTVGNAIVFLGVDRTKSMAFTVAMKSYMQNTLGTPAVKQCWLHSLACAQLAEELAGMYGMRKDWAYTAGLMHDIGRLGLIKAYGVEYMPLLTTEYETLKDSLREEQRLFGFDHCKAGAWLTRVWNFPEELSTTAECHHEVFAAQEHDLLPVVQLSCQLADSLNFEAIRYQDRLNYTEILAQLPEDLRARFRFSFAELQEKISQKVGILQS